ncbi:MAG TPA: hypothetical protein PKD64_08035 [Pirellulaceae bacterium]|nr:hypothetical protein [Pirellulaceae bacterium]HMO92137.1 hypothetical protein [Pirellulaceae bacterium]HMP68938.1 hypothetical protein [Pirellulaceae bacterium]
MAKCEEGYICDVCNADVESIEQSDLYLRFIIGEIDPELLHTAPERHIRCNPALAQFIISPKFAPVTYQGNFSKNELDPEFVKRREDLVTRGWYRLQEIVGQDIPVIEYPLPEVIERFRKR